jgi:glycosyltransferase involved in cell wall biosynthesis
MAQSKPLISVVLPVWNGERYLVESIDSILSQTLSDLELIVVDDGSTDRSLEIIRSYKDPRVRVFVRERQGLAPTLDFGIQRARARWIARQDADDASHPQRLELQMQTLEENPEAILCYCDVELVGESVYFPSIERFPHTMGLLAMQLCYQCPIAHSSVIFDRGAYREVGGYSVSEQYAEDFGLWGRLIRYGDFVSLPKKLVKFRLHGESITTRARGDHNEMARGIAIRHCAEFFRLDVVHSIRAYRTLMREAGSHRYIDWLWLLFLCVPRLKWKGAELHSWLAGQSVRRLVGR